MARHPRTRTVAALCAAATLLTTAACGGGGEAEADGTVTLRFSYFTSENNPIARTWKQWMDEVTERSGGTIEFEQYWDATLLAGDEVVEGLVDGRADIAQVTPTFYPGRFPLTAVNELPFGTNNVGAISSAMSTLIKEDDDLAAEWSSQDLVPLAWNVGGSSAIASNRELATAEDFRGLKVRGMDRGSRALDANGANVIALAPTELYGSMDRGLLDAVYGVQFGALPSLKLEEISDYVVDASTGAQTASTLAMGQAGWDRLSGEQQAVIEEVSAEIPAMYEEQNRAAEAEACAAFGESGSELSVLDSAEVEKLRATGQDVVVDGWLAEVEEAGYDGAAFRETYDAAVEAASADFPDGDESGVARCIAAG
jgi:TRAP-type transport system periplasmic protein